MPCQNMQFWTFTSLVGSFLDLGIAYFVLCASTLAYFTSGFLGLFGLRLPCPCDGFFTRSRNNYCMQRLLVDYPNEKVGYVLCSVRNKYPFHSELANDENVGVKLVEDRSDHGNGYYVDFEAEASCSSVSDAKVSRNAGEKEMVSRNGNGFEFNIGRWPDKKIDMKGKGLNTHRPRANLRRRRKGGFDLRRSSSVSSHDRVGIPRYSGSIKKEKNEDIEGMSASDDADANYMSDDRKAPSVRSTGGSGLPEVDLNRFISEMNLKEKYESSNEDSRSDVRGAFSLGDEINTIGVLEQALKTEHAARVALYIELDEERNAAASAADEAMAMILRLQEEKASIEMQARQYQREREEKSAYDTEEMNILKEIVLRREREKHFLEKEVEAYRQMMCSGKEQFEGDTQSVMDKQRRELFSGYQSDDTDLMLHELSESIGKNTVAKGRSSNAEVTFKDTRKRPLIQLGSSEWDEDDIVPQQQDKDNYSSLNCSNDVNQELQEKEMVSIDNSQLPRPIEGQRSNNSEEPRFPESTTPFISDEQEKNGFEDTYGGITKKHEKDMMESTGQSNVAEKEPDVYDVHVINDKSKFLNEASGKKTELLPKTDTSKVISPDVSQEVSDIHNNGTKRESSSTSKIGTTTDFNRSSLDMAMRLPPSGPREKSVPVSRRSSISVSDTERLKIDIEVEWLRDKLRAVQERRTKLNISVDHDKEKLQLQLLEDIASQLREIRLMTHPEKAMRQVSLPLPSSEAMTKKRRHPSAYLNNSS